VTSGIVSNLRPSWDDYFIRIVDTVAERATCNRGRAGCVITRDHDIIASGYVGAPPGFPHCDDVGHMWDETGKHCIRTLHAEQNAVIRAARQGISVAGATVYCTMEPCTNCTMTLIALNVKRIVAKNAYHAAQPGREMLWDAKIALITLAQETLYES
jgi:dCMP deaminase